MSLHLTALVYILILATVVFAFAKAPACALASTAGDFKRRRNLWFCITLVAFLAFNFWAFIIVAAALILFALPREPNKLAMFFFLLFAAPMFEHQISGLEIIAHFFSINYLRLLTLTVLLPAYLYLRKQPEVDRFGRLLPDKFIAGYLVLQCALMLQNASFTGTLRSGVFYPFIDIFLPYYVASRSLRNLPAFRDALMAFVMAALVLAAIGVMENARHWLLYYTVDQMLGGLTWGYGNYHERGQGALRAMGSTGHPVVLGYVLTVAAGFMLYLRKLVSNQTAWRLGLVLLIAGLIASLARGPWVGAAAMSLVFIATGPSPGKVLVKLGLVGITILPVVLATPLGERIIALLPFVGKFDEGTVTYRQDFTRISIDYILAHPVFGDPYFHLSREMEALSGRGGLLDTLNVFLTVGLGSGLVGMSLFTGAFIASAVGIFNGMRNQADRNGELYLLGRALLSTLLGIMVVLCTVSAILFVPVVYWSVIGLGVSYARMLALAQVPAQAAEAARSSRFQPTAIKSL